MSTLSAKHRLSLCSFTFADGRRCRTPRSSSHPHFCFFHARKEAQARAADQLGRDISFFLSGDYLSACDLSSALGRVFAAVAQGHIKPKTAATLAYLGHTLLKTIQLSQHEYINAFGSDSWRNAVRSSFKANSDYSIQDSAHASTPHTSAPRELQPNPAPQASARTKILPTAAPQPAQPNPPRPSTTPPPGLLREPRSTPLQSCPHGESQPAPSSPSTAARNPQSPATSLQLSAPSASLPTTPSAFAAQVTALHSQTRHLESAGDLDSCLPTPAWRRHRWRWRSLQPL